MTNVAHQIRTITTTVVTTMTLVVGSWRTAHAQSLAKGDIDINNYISTGSNRKTFYGAVAPRLGFSYDLLGDGASVVYAGWGRAYDRAMANNAMDELQRNLGTGDQFMIRNDYKMPYSDQLSVGLRQALRQSRATPAEIAREAEAAGVWATMEPYVMALTSDA
jgi:hypothetical protein